jgi:hypothetical protein
LFPGVVSIADDTVAVFTKFPVFDDATAVTVTV